MNPKDKSLKSVLEIATDWLKYEDYLKGRAYRLSSIKRQIIHVKTFYKWLVQEAYSLDQFDYRQVLHYIEICRLRGVRESTLAHYLRYLHVYFDYLKEQDLIRYHPLQSIRLRSQVRQRSEALRLDKLLDDQKMNIIFKCYQQNPRLKLRNKILLSFAAYQGVESSEFKLIQGKHIDVEQAQLFVPQSTVHEARYIPLRANQILLLSRYLSEQSAERYLFEYATASQATNSRSALCAQVKIELQRHHHLNIGFKNLPQLRKSRISIWIKEKGLRQAQYLAGHHNINSTQRYKTTDMNALQQGISQYHPLK